MDKLISMIETLLPGTLSKWILGLSLPISGFLLTWPSYDLPARYLSDTEVIKLILRLLSAGIPLIIGFGSLFLLLAYHNKKITAQNTELKSTLDVVTTDAHENAKSVKQLQTILAETKQALEDLTGKHVSLRQSYAELTQQNKEQIEKVDMLSTAADSFRDEARQMHTHANEIQKELTSLKDEYKDLKQRNAGTEALALMRGRNINQLEKELEDLKKAPTVKQINMNGYT